MIIIDRPPNFALIKEAFPDADKPGVLFAYDGNIYNPSDITVPPALIAHENVHLERQALLVQRVVDPRPRLGADEWWDRYIHDPEFRYREELLAHVAEYKAQCSYTDRNLNAGVLARCALRLTAPLYNYQPPRTLQQALKDLRKEIEK